MLNVPKKANDAMHLSLLENCDVSIDKLGEVVLQDAFQAWDTKQIIRKGRERRVFLFELYLLFAKEVKESSVVKYQFKSKLMTTDMGITEHIEGDETKFAVWTGRSPMLSDCRIVLKATSLETKQVSALVYIFKSLGYIIYISYRLKNMFRFFFDISSNLYILSFRFG